MNGRDAVSHNILEGYQSIITLLKMEHKDKPFNRTELMDLFLQELDVLREETQGVHIKTMMRLGFIILVSPGTAYQDAKYRLGPKAFEGATID